METQFRSLNYNREQVKAGIVHIGVGNFHRAHEEYYTNQLLEDQTQQCWGNLRGRFVAGRRALGKGPAQTGT